MRFFTQILFFCAFAVKIDVALPLIAFGDCVPVLLRRLDAVLLHPRIYKLVLTLAYFAEVMQLLPKLNVETVADKIEQHRHGTGRQVIVYFRRTVAERRNPDGQFAVGADIRLHTLRQLCHLQFESLALDGTASKLHRHIAAVFADEPLREIVFQRQIDTKVAHNIADWYIQSYQISAC